MNKIYRDGVDVQIAFASATKRILCGQHPFDAVETNLEHSEQPMVEKNAEVSEQRNSGLRSRLKNLLRLPARLVYRILKPAFRPIAFRLRRYLTAGLHQGMLHAQFQQELQRVSADVVQEIQAARELLRQDILNNPAQSVQDLKQVSAAMLQEVQATRELLRQDILNNQAQSARLDRIEQYSGAAARRVAIPCNQDEILVRTEVGYVLCAASDHAVLVCLIEAGELERGTRLLIQRFLSPGDVFVDVGANLGLHTLAAARAMQGRGKIIAFEPFDPTKRLLEKSVWMNGFSEITEIHQAAVSNKAGHQKLFLGATSGHHSLFPLNTPSGLSGNPVEVPLVRLDEVIIPVGEKVNLIKIDAEGAELDVLESAVSLIKQNPDIALIVEFGSAHLKRTGHSTPQWLAAFTDLGLRYRAINPDTGALEDWSLDQLENTDSINLFFACTNSKAWMKAETTT